MNEKRAVNYLAVHSSFLIFTGKYEYQNKRKYDSNRTIFEIREL